jgi:hypothetical protein
LWQVLELLEGLEIRQDRWAMPVEAAADDEAPWLDDLDDDEEEFNAASSPSSSSSTASN